MINLSGLQSVVAKHAINGDPSRVFKVKLMAVPITFDRYDGEFVLLDPHGHVVPLNHKDWELTVLRSNGKPVNLSFNMASGRLVTSKAFRIPSMESFQCCLRYVGDG